MDRRELTCIECPRGCSIVVQTEGGKVVSVSGNKCVKGGVYAKAEVTAPVRTVTGTVRTNFGGALPVKTSVPVLKSDIFAVMAAINAACISTSVKIGDIIIKNADGKGADVIACDCRGAETDNV